MILENSPKIIRIDSYQKVNDNLVNKNNWYKKAENMYYFKILEHDEQIVSELLGSYLAKYFRLPTITYQIAQKGNDYGLLSADLRKNQQLFNNYHIWDNYYTNLKEFLINIDKEFSNKLLLQQFFSVALLNIIMNEDDFNIQSFLFTGHDKQDLSLIGVLDFAAGSITMADKKYYFPLANDLFIIDVTELSAIINRFPSLEDLLTKFLNVNISYFLNLIENDYEISIPKFIKNNCLDYEHNIKKYVKHKLM